MPNYYNPYNFYPATYPGVTTGQPLVMQPMSWNSTSQQQSFAQIKAMEWVEGEVGAKAYQMPPGWPANQPIPLWDSTDTVIFLKSWSPGGFPNPMQKLHYEMPETPQQQMIQSGAVPAIAADYATKDDVKSLREEVQAMKESMMNGRRNQNGSGNNGVNNQNSNRGGNSNG